MIRNVIITILLLSSFISFAQDSEYHMTGLLPDDGTYNTVPEKPQLLSRDYTLIPPAHSLRKYTPFVRSQGSFGTCTSWAVAYAARTIVEAVNKEWSDQQQITREAFSPLYLYAQIKQADDANCKKGSHIFKALEKMKYQGVVKIREFDNLCADPEDITNSLIEKAGNYRIDDFYTLFKLGNVSGETKVARVKKAIAENCPVVIAMWLPKSFNTAGKSWNGIDVNPDDHGYHALCVVGYDDSHNGGSFEIMNSWGRNWGDQGFTWVKYSDFGKYVDQAYEIYLNKNHGGNRQVNHKSLGGDVLLRLSTGEDMKAKYNKDDGCYRLVGSYISGTRYRVYIKNNEPAYLFIIGSDLTNRMTTVFPPSESISPALTYHSSSIAVPDERYFIEIDSTPGTDYMCILYSAEPLDLGALKKTISLQTGSFPQRVYSALGKKLIRSENIVYDQSKINFSTNTSTGSVVPIIVEIPHR